MDTAFEKARAAYVTGAYDDATLEFIFPELKESEDEQIRKAIIKSLDMPFPEDNLPGTDVTYKEAVDWLEKQNHDGKKWITPAELNRLLSFIDSLQHEQPEVESQKIKAWIAREWGPNGRLRMFNFLPKKCPCGYEWEGNSWVINDIMPDLSYTNSPIEVELTISILNARKEDK